MRSGARRRAPARPASSTTCSRRCWTKGTPGSMSACRPPGRWMPKRPSERSLRRCACLPIPGSPGAALRWRWSTPASIGIPTFCCPTITSCATCCKRRPVWCRAFPLKDRVPARLMRGVPWPLQILARREPMARRPGQSAQDAGRPRRAEQRAARLKGRLVIAFLLRIPLYAKLDAYIDGEEDPAGFSCLPTTRDLS